MGQSRWIVLIDKTPRGPLTESEVRTLIEQRVVRVNDLASRIEPAPEGKKAEWKFLWQYPEFDRRREKDKNTDSRQEERRDEKSVQKLEEQKKHLLPEELENIHPEDLSYHSTGQPVHDKQSFENSVYESPSAPSFSQPRQFNWRAFAVIPVMLIAGIAAFKLTSGPSTPITNSKAKPEMEMPTFGVKGDPEYERDVSSETQSNGSSPLSRTQPKVDKPTPPPIPRREERREPAPPPDRAKSNSEDSGDISYDEYRRRQDEQIEKDKSEDDDRQRAEESSDEDEERPTKKKSSKKRKAASEEEEEAADPLEETLDEEHRE